MLNYSYNFLYRGEPICLCLKTSSEAFLFWYDDNMLVKALRDYGYGTAGVTKDKLYIVYAVAEDAKSIEYAVYSATADSEEMNPLYFPAGKFKVLADRVSPSWLKKEIPEDPGTIYASFPEFFAIDGFWYRLHDWDLKGSDFEVISKYTSIYRETYKNIIEGLEAEAAA